VIERVPILPVIVPDEESRDPPVRRGFPSLLRHLSLGRLARHAHMHDPMRSQFDDEEQV
jgi:hypothetical protein